MKEVNKEKLKSFLLPLLEGFDDKNGYPVKYLQPQWEMIFHTIVCYITCDGRYSSVDFYHLRILMAFKGSKLNLPYFLFKSLQKMAIAIQSTIAEHDRSLFHHGLVKILVQYQLSFINVTWDQFLSKNGFGQNEEWPSIQHPTRQKRRHSNGSKVV